MEINNTKSIDNTENHENTENAGNENNVNKNSESRTPIYISTVNYSADDKKITRVSLDAAKAKHNELTNFEKAICRDYMDCLPLFQMVSKYGVSKSSISRTIEKIKSKYGIKSRNQLETIACLYHGWWLTIKPEVRKRLIPWLLMNDYSDLHRMELKKLIAQRKLNK